MLTEEELAEVTDETALLLRNIVARNPRDLAVAFIEIVGTCFMADHARVLPTPVMDQIRKSLQKFPRLENHLAVLAEEAANRAEKR